MDFRDTLVASVYDVIDGAVTGVRSINMGALEVDGKLIKLTMCAEPALFSTTQYANYPEDGEEVKVVAKGELDPSKHQTTSVIEQLRSLEQ